MRKRKTGKVTVNAIAGTHVVFLGLDMAKSDTSGLLGFAIQREDLVENEVTWLRGNKTFPSVALNSGSEDHSSDRHPFQAFQWADYTAKPGYRYRYTVVPKTGSPSALVDGPSTTVEIPTEKAEGATHSVYFNRGAIGSQAYSKRFGPVDPEEKGPAAYEWLTRDLLPGLLAFIGRAVGPDFGLYAAIYEAQLPVALDALRQAHLRGAKVKLLYGGRPGDQTTTGNEAAIASAGIVGLSKPRTKAKIAHNKFIVLTRKLQPVAVWTGSANWSRNAIYGQLNVGHVVEDATLAGRFLAYWNELSPDPDSASIKDWIEANNDPINSTPANPVVEVFSPHRGRAVFDWYKTLLTSGPKPIFVSLPFGIVKDFRPVFDFDDGVLRYALLEMYVNGGNAASRAAAIADIKRIRKFQNIGMTLGSHIFLKDMEGWVEESKGIGTFVNWIHTKFALIDPLGAQPVTISGSANWSLPSVNENDENMLVVRGTRAWRISTSPSSCGSLRTIASANPWRST